MKKLLLLFAVVLFSCSPQKRLNRIYSTHPDLKPTDKIEVVEKERKVIVYRDTVINVPVLEYVTRTDTIYETMRIEVPRNVTIHTDTLFIESDLADAWGFIDANELNLGIKDKDTTLHIRLNNAIKESSYYKSRLEEKTTVVREKYVPRALKVFTWSFFVLLILIGLYIFYRIKKKKIDRLARYAIDMLK
jgi:hypothetical protein